MQRFHCLGVCDLESTLQKSGCS